LADRTEVHVYTDDNKFHEFFGSAPVIGFVVDSFAEAQAAMLQFGIEFVYPDAQRHAGQAWQDFRAPSGNVNATIGPDDLDAKLALVHRGLHRLGYTG
jgi:hypothetical protein